MSLSGEPTPEEAIDVTTSTRNISFISPGERCSLKSSSRTTNVPMPPRPPPGQVAGCFSSARSSFTNSSDGYRRHASIILDDRIQSLIEFDRPEESIIVESSSDAWREEADISVPSYIPTNLNFFWLVLASLAVWFLLILSPHSLVMRGRVGQDTSLVIHVVGIYCIYFACVHNTIMTPSTTLILGGKQTARPVHVFIGRFGMIGGVCSVISGLYLAWHPMQEFGANRAIFVTLIGAIQLSFQLVGYGAIKKYQRLKREISNMEDNRSTNTTDQEDTNDGWEQLKIKCEAALKLHIICMVGLFVIPCSGAATVRLRGELGLPKAVFLPLIPIIHIFVIWPWYVYVYYLRKLNKPSNETGAEDDLQEGCTGEGPPARENSATAAFR